MTSTGRCLAMIALILAAPGASSARSDGVDPGGARFYEVQVRPILESRCLTCHGGVDGKRRGGLDLSNRAGVLRGGDFGPAIDVEVPEASTLLEAIRYEGLEMPPSGPLEAAEIDILTRWVELGGPDGTSTGGNADIPDESTGSIFIEDRGFWSFQPVQRPEIPGSDDERWVRDPIDAFVLHRLEAEGLRPAAPASKLALIRRLSFDLLGLPPTPEEVDRFLGDNAEGAYEALVDRLLASPSYGERWGRHWLDLVRFAETNSFERDSDKPFSWRYRDYVIDAFNRDLPYDTFIREQIAGDELDAVTADSIIATGYYRLNAWDDDPTDRLQARFDELDDILTTTSQTLLGVTINCARCHDHKIDPIPQRDYYRFLAFFENILPYSYEDENILTDIANDAEHEAHARASERRSSREREIESALAPLEADLLANVPEPRRKRLLDGPFERRRHVLDGIAERELSASEFETYGALIERWEALPEVPPMPMALSVRERGPEPEPSFVLIRGGAHDRGDPVKPGFPEVLGGLEPPPSSPEPGSESSGRRRILADWIAAPDNPLTARVMVNRVWHYHFGRGIVRTPSDFGFQGTPPTHPELLDWLASDFVAGGWRLKPLHRRIVLSSTYRMSSTFDPKADAVDPANDLLWRFEGSRLEAEEIRDAILAVAGRINPKMGGPGIYPTIPDSYLAGQSRPGQGWGRSSLRDRERRSVYIHVKRSLMTPILASFDAPETDFTCPVRFATTQPTQALSTINGEFLNRQARLLADRVRRESGVETADRVARALRLTTSRAPTDAEVRRGVDLVEGFRVEDDLGADRALDLFCLLALNLNEFLYLD